MATTETTANRSQSRGFNRFFSLRLLGIMLLHPTLDGIEQERITAGAHGAILKVFYHETGVPANRNPRSTPARWGKAKAPPNPGGPFHTPIFWNQL
jgi:hypothetical protein